MIYFSKTGSYYADKVYKESKLLYLFTNIDEGKSLKRFLDENIHCLKHGSETRYLIMINRIKLHKYNRIGAVVRYINVHNVTESILI